MFNKLGDQINSDMILSSTEYNISPFFLVPFNHSRSESRDVTSGTAAWMFYMALY
jgi:hypothetical protein